MNFPDRFTKARISLLGNRPFWGNLAMSLHLVEDKTCPTTAVNLNGDFIYNPEWVEKLSHVDLMAEIEHELGHLFTETLNRFPISGYHEVWNKAADIVIDTMLMDSGTIPSWIMKEATNKELQDKYRGKSTNEVYHDLLTNAKQMKICFSMEGDGKENPNGQTPDVRKCSSGSLANKAKGANKDKVEKQLAQWRKKIYEAAEMAKARGKLPGHLQEWLSELLEPKVRWQDYLRLKASQTMRRKHSWRVEGRRGVGLGIRLPGKHPRLPEAVIAMDTSGSVSGKERTEFASESSEILRLTGGKVRLILFDAEVYYDQEIQNFTEVNKIQCGGTDFDVVFKHIEESDNPKPNLLVFFTDGYAPKPTEAPGYPVVWALTPNHDSTEFNFGETVVVE